MDKKKIFITGGTGFLGSAVLKYLVKNNYEIMATMRTETDMFRFKTFSDEVKWINTDDENYKKQIIAFEPTIIFHAAWSGVTSSDRNDWSKQIQNFQLLADILDIANNVKLEKILVLGSQSEYGNVHTRVNENHPREAYAVSKNAMQNIIEKYCNQYNIEWYWLRVFSVFGPGETKNWFIPWVIVNQLKNNDTNLTLCEQQYDYLYISDFVKMIIQIINATKSASGIYNICSGNSTILKTIVEYIKQCIGSSAKINYGAIPYRPNQSMQITGDNSKYNINFGRVDLTEFEHAMNLTISYYKEQYLSDNNMGL